jgi:hypothetical protein
MDKRNESDVRITNDELARRLFQRDKQPAPPAPVGLAQQRAPEALASRREVGEAPQTWSLGRSLESGLDPVSERERRALFAALSKGTRANLGREPTVAELVRLVEEVNRARALVSSSQEAIQGQLSVYFDCEKLAFRGSMQSLVQKANGKQGVA